MSKNSPSTSKTNSVSSTTKRAADQPSTSKALFASPSKQMKSENGNSPPKKQKQGQITSIVRKQDNNSSKLKTFGLKNLFTNEKLHVGASCTNKEKLERYFIAYDGDLAESYEVDSKTIVICSDQEYKSLQYGKRVK